MEQLDVTKKWR